MLCVLRAKFEMDKKANNFKHVLIPTHELRDSYDKGATRRDRLVIDPR